jgi:hypothetical protein
MSSIMIATVPTAGLGRWGDGGAGSCRAAVETGFCTGGATLDRGGIRRRSAVGGGATGRSGARFFVISRTMNAPAMSRTTTSRGIKGDRPLFFRLLLTLVRLYAKPVSSSGKGGRRSGLHASYSTTPAPNEPEKAFETGLNRINADKTRAKEQGTCPPVPANEEARRGIPTGLFAAALITSPDRPGYFFSGALTPPVARR